MSNERTPTLILIGGFAGSGKTTISRRLSRELVVPCIEADTLGKTIRSLDFFNGASDEAYRIGYASLWRLCEDFLGCGVSVIVDANMAWEVTWEAVDAIRERVAGCRVVPVILRCPRDVCLERIRRRYRDEPGWHGDPERFTNDHASMQWDYLANLDRPEIAFVDSGRDIDEVYAEVKARIAASFSGRGDSPG